MSLFPESTPQTQQVHFQPQHSLGPFTGYVIVEEVITDKLTITDHPVQEGAKITDHAYKEPTRVTLRGIYSAKTGPLDQLYADMLALQASREPFAVTTAHRTHQNMLFESLVPTYERETHSVFAFSAELREIIIVSVTTVSVPTREKQAQPEKTDDPDFVGPKQPQEYGVDLAGPPAPTRNSILSDSTGVVGADSLGDFF